MFKQILSVTLAALLIAGCGGEAKVEMEEKTTGTAEESGESQKKEKEEVPVPEGMIPINELSAEELASYKVKRLGIGTAEKIIAHREENGPFKNFDDLDAAPGVGPAMLDALKERGVDFGAAAAEAPEGSEESAAPEQTKSEAPKKEAASSGGKININKASVEELDSLKGIGKKTAEAIVEYRKANGPFKSVDELNEVKGIGDATLEKIRNDVTI